ncbi:MAG TPA: AsmA family protein [Bryobacteraceae bacterium]|nr:AsmA family protein [Bryobacteraceae bacterium]
MRRARRFLLWGVALFLAVGLAAPFVQANRFGGRVQRALESSLHRKVRIGAVHFNLLTGPGFSINDVLIEEDPTFGVEPIASVNTLSARVSLSSLWTGRLQFSALTLEEPRVNLAKAEEGTWNLVKLLEQSPVGVPRKPGTSQATNVPSIHVRSGRINFKLGDRKSALYLANADADITPGSNGSFQIRFQGEPSRTDTAARSFGTIRGRGGWRQANGSPGELAIQLELAKSNIGEMARLFRGRDYGLHGLVASRADIKGPLDNLTVSGQLQLSDIHRWDEMPEARGGEWRLQYIGQLNWPGQVLEFTAMPKLGENAPIELRLRAAGLLANPTLASTVTMRELPAAGVIEVLRHMGAGLPQNLQVVGAVTGVLGYSSSSAPQGTVNLQNAVLKTRPSDEPVFVPSTDLKLVGERFFLTSTEVQLGERQFATLEGDFSVREPDLRLQVRGRALDVASIQDRASNLFGSASMPWLSNLKGGRWTGTMQFIQRSGEPGTWASGFELRNSTATIPGLADPVRIQAALVENVGEHLRLRKLRGTIANVPISGEYQYVPKAARPHKINITVGAIEIGEVERLLAPTLNRRQGFFARTLRFGGGSTPEWLRTRAAEGRARFSKVSGPGFLLDNLQSSFVWDGLSVDFAKVEGKLESGDIDATLSVSLDTPEPQYRLAGRIQGMSWHGGKLDVEGRAEMEGTGPALLATLRSDGVFQARSVDLLEENTIKAVTGSYVWDVTDAGPRLVLKAVEASVDGDRFSGEGATEAGVLQVALTSGSKTMRIAGPVATWKLDVVSR